MNGYVIAENTINAEDFKLTEASIIGFSQRGGWVSERESLSATELELLIERISDNIIWPKSKLRTMLSHIFANIFAEIHAVRRFAQAELFPGRPKAIRELLDRLLRLYDVSDNQCREEQCDTIRNAVSKMYRCRQERVCLYFLDFLSGQFPKVNYPKSLFIHMGKASDEDVLNFKNLVLFARGIAAQNVKRGGNGKPFYRQMCLALGTLYEDCTGVIPRRHFDNKTDKDTGRLHCLSAKMAELIEAHMPAEIQQTPPKLPRICRDIIDILDQEAQQMAA